MVYRYVALHVVVLVYTDDLLLLYSVILYITLLHYNIVIHCFSLILQHYIVQLIIDYFTTYIIVHVAACVSQCLFRLSEGGDIYRRGQKQYCLNFVEIDEKTGTEKG